uniref:Bestrophin homolog n=1 Tax=Heterorhabditis bacteriophora TaxID=37862 RepID=A0A1I7XSD9_HETBA
MTVNYNKLASTSKPWTFFKLLLTWKASIWKAVYLELLVFLTIYGIISVVYRCALGQQQQKSFETVVRYFDSRLSYIPLELVLGFFCTQIINRWTKQYETIGFIDNIGLMTALYVRGRSERARLYRRNILRYCELMQVLEIKKWRTNLEWVFNYDWVPLPLMYPQIDVYFPIMTALQFVFYMGWMKVIEVVLNPFGEDDDDFETNALIDRNITMGMMIVDQGYDHPPDLLRDPFWDEIHPLYSEETACIRNNPPKGSISHVKLAHNVKEVIMMPHGTSSDGIQMQIEKPKLRRSTVRVKECDIDFSLNSRKSLNLNKEISKLQRRKSTPTTK